MNVTFILIRFRVGAACSTHAAAICYLLATSSL
jgi:hypothetical protein